VNRNRKNNYLQLISLGIILTANPLFAQTIQYVYDKDGRLTQVTHSDGVADTYQYDAANNLIKNTGVPDDPTATFRLTDYTPKSGIVGAVLTITGTAFSNPAVSFNGIPATISASTDTSITVPVPTGATSGPLTVTVGGQTLTAGAFNVLANPNAFSVVDFTPKTAAVGNSLTIKGTGFTNPTVTINGLSAPVTASTTTSITVTVPTGVTSGPVVVSVNGQSQTAGTFTAVRVVTAPVLGAYALPIAKRGDVVTLSGSGFDTSSPSANVVTVGNDIADVTEVTDTYIKFVVPLGAAVPNNPIGTSGTATTIKVQNSGGITTAPKPLYLVPNITFNKSLDLGGTTTPGTLSSYGDNGLLILSGQGTDYRGRTLVVNMTNVTGTGYLNVFVFDTQNNRQYSFKVPSQTFNLVNGASFQTKTGEVSLPGSGPYIVQSFFEYGVAGVQFTQATGTLTFSLERAPVTLNAAATVFNPIPGTMPSTSVNTAASVFNPIPGSMPPTTVNTSASVFNPIPGTSPPTAVNTAASVFNPIPGSSSPTTANTAASVFNPVPGAPPVVSTDTKANAAASVYNPVPGTRPPTTVNTAASIYNPIPGTSSPTTVNTAASIYNPIPGASPPTAVNTAASVFNPIPGVKPPTAVNAAASVCNPGGNAVCP
jgi:YD repeat-containing protein